MTQQDRAGSLAPLTVALSRADLPTTPQPPTVLFSLWSSASLQDRGTLSCGLANIPERWGEEDGEEPTPPQSTRDPSTPSSSSDLPAPWQLVTYSAPRTGSTLSLNVNRGKRAIVRGHRRFLYLIGLAVRKGTSFGVFWCQDT